MWEKPKDTAWSLSEYVVYLIESKQTTKPEFQTLLTIFGREKLEKIWKDYKAKSREREPGEDD